ncbi:hypothetical protein C0585_02265 [Candidatus Woesearchaeota archaeon]|nr:MAG: hypothetical protein C0585_02265 [Candidatus Woesearchaeota archaeon]
MNKGQVISGSFGEIIIRQKNDENIEIGEMLVCDNPKLLLQVYDLSFGSQISQQNIELISGMRLEENTDFEFMDEKLRNYNIAYAKNLISLEKGNISKSLPKFFSIVRDIEKEDLKFLEKPKDSIFLGNLRSGSKKIEVPVYLDGKEVFSHHVLIPATTGRGKSNLTSCILFDSIDKNYVGHLVLDPHDEYFGRNEIGLKDHPSKDKVTYYTSNEPPVGGISLKINIEDLKPSHFNGVIDWSGPQKEALTAYYRAYNSKWIESIVLEKPLKIGFNEATLAVVRRRIMNLLDLDFDGNELFCNGIFDITAGKTTISNICNKLENSNTVIIDTSSFSGSLEILVGSMIANEIFKRYKKFKDKGEKKPIISIVLEEAPRVLGKEVLEKGSNIFSTIAREGRKFGVGLMAITQLPSLIPRQILANMNTKIILGIEMAPERLAIIESASQDLSKDNRNIASLDKGEAIITSNFSKFAMPVKIPYFNELVEKYNKEKEPVNDHKKSFVGVKI